jgi:hypothetical protein
LGLIQQIINPGSHHRSAPQQMFAAPWCIKQTRPHPGCEGCKISRVSSTISGTPFSNFPNEKFPVMALVFLQSEIWLIVVTAAD